MSAIVEIGTVVIPVADQDRAIDFYVGTLGFEKRLDAPFGEGMHWVEVATPGAELRRHGVDADEEVMRMGGGVPPMFTFRDSDGNPFRWSSGRECRFPAVAFV